MLRRSFFISRIELKFRSHSAVDTRKEPTIMAIRWSSKKASFNFCKYAYNSSRLLSLSESAFLFSKCLKVETSHLRTLVSELNKFAKGMSEFSSKKLVELGHKDVIPLIINIFFSPNLFWSSRLTLLMILQTSQKYPPNPTRATSSSTYPRLHNHAVLLVAVLVWQIVHFQASLNDCLLLLLYPKLLAHHSRATGFDFLL